MSTRDASRAGMLRGFALMASGCAMGVAVSLMTEAFRHAEAAFVASFRYPAVLWAMLFGLIAFADKPDAAMLCGAAPVVASGLHVRHREALHGESSESVASRFRSWSRRV